MVAVLRTTDFIWRGLDLHFGRRRVLTLVADATYPHLYRIIRVGGPAPLQT